MVISQKYRGGQMETDNQKHGDIDKGIKAALFTYRSI